MSDQKRSPVGTLILQILIKSGDKKSKTIPAMAERIGTSPSSISRALRRLKANGLIKMDGYTRTVTPKGEAELYGL